MLTFLIVSPPNFAISSSRPSLHTLTSTLHGASPLLSTPTLGTLRFASPHSLALQASSLLLGVTPIRHFVHVVRSLTMPWKSQWLSQRFSTSVSVSLLQDWSTEDLKLDVCSSFNYLLSPSMHIQLELLTPISRRGTHMNHSTFLGIDGLMTFTSSMSCIWCTLTVFIRILNHAPLLPNT